ncbi:MAG: VOC family protein [Pseudomonadota bacterium]
MNAHTNINTEKAITAPAGNAAVNHIGVTVDDIDRGIAFYIEALGYRLIAGPLEIVPDNSHFGQLARDVLGLRLTRGQFAHLFGTNGIGLELFSFEDPDAGRRDEVEYWKNRFYHIALTAPDIDIAIARIEAAGGRRRTNTWETFPGAGRYLAYAEDPFGNPIEISKQNYESTWVLAAVTQAAQTDIEEKDGPVTFVVELKARAKHPALSRELTKAVIPSALSEPSAQNIELFSAPLNPTRILLIQEWGTQQGAPVQIDDG